MWIDTHCHLDAPEFSSSLMEIIASAREKNVLAILVPAVKAADTQNVQSLVSQYSNEIPGLVYTLGIHPLYTNQAHESDLNLLGEQVSKALSNPRFVGIGEIGLDYFVEGLDPHKQEYFFHAQLDLAEQFKLPVILHVRRSQDAILKALRRRKIPGGIAHAFNGSFQQA
jgi:TatD DNase family protein